MGLSNEWEQIYLQDYKSLPWFNLPFSKELQSLLNSLDKEKKLIVTGCGAGDTAHRLNKLGFNNIRGYDISKNAIGVARKNFPRLNFKVSKTEEIKDKNCNIFDQYVVHHISKSGLKRYINKLDKMGDNIICIFFYGKKEKRKSIIKKRGKVYHHNPKKIERLFRNHILTKQASYSVRPNVPDKEIKYTAIAQHYIKK